MTHPPNNSTDVDHSANDAAPVIVLMGVAGAGKTTVGQALAKALRCAFVEGDDFHPPANLERMRLGMPLTDADRAPWLAALRARIAAALTRGERAVVACSALKQSYRDALVPVHGNGLVRFVYLHVDPERVKARLEQRSGHFAGTALLESQLATLEEPLNALHVDGTLPPDTIVARIRAVYRI